MDADQSEWASEPIAIIGMSCKFSGGASNPERLWDLLASGKTGWSEIPADRFNLKGVYHHNHERTSTSHVKGGHFIDEDVANFDAAFFNYSAEMAQAVDPQFRLQLESTHEALENAGLTLPQVAGSNTSVFGGVFTHDYEAGILRDEDRLPRFNVVGTWSPMSSNRISHFFDFRGASMTLETGCSTTLVALHQGVQTLRNREADMSVITGANVMLNPDVFKAIGSLGMLSPDGKCWSFDTRANGYGRGEGVATVIIKRLSDALADNDPIRAIIRETALNQDGKTDTITTPSGPAQVELMRECYRRAGLDPRGTQYFEAHGTGTPTGDPIEGAAMSAIFAEGREDEKDYLRIGSVKTNVGHTEAASGLAAVIKGVLCLEKGLLPPSVNYEKPNPKLKLDEWRLKVQTGMSEWPASLIDGPKRLSVNNFGYGGANAHVIMESSDPWTSTPELDSNDYSEGEAELTDDPADSKVLILSARDERGCQQLVTDLKAYLEKNRSLAPTASAKLLRDLSYTLGERRTLFQWIAAHQVRLDENGTLEQAIQALESPRFKPVRQSADNPRIGMVFTGQGAQWYAMGRELLQSYPVFRDSIDEAEVHLRALGADWSLYEELQRSKDTTRVHHTAISIPVCVALQIALVQLLESWGITPAGVVSHSSGEIAAAFAVGALTQCQAMAAAYYRSVLAADESLRPADLPKGAMAAVGLGAQEVQPYLQRLTTENGKAVIACVNSPQSVTIAGDATAVQAIEDLCKQDGVFARKLKVQQAYHSHHMEPFAEAYRERLQSEMDQEIHNRRASKELKARFSSAVTGGRIDNINELASPDHWVGSLVGAVEFVDAFTDMVLGDLDDPTGRSVDVILEVGPHTALGGPIREILSQPEFEGLELPYWGCLVRDEHAGDSMRTAAINLLRKGQPLIVGQINFPVPAYDDESPRVLTDLPTYPWNHTKRHWQESRVNRAIRERSEPPHELLGMPVAGTDPNISVWRRVLRVAETPWITDHMVQGTIVYPGAGSVCMAIEAARQLEKGNVSGFRLRDIKFLFALVVPDGADGVEIRTTLRPVPEREIGARGWRRFEVSSVTLENRWTRHAEGMIFAERDVAPESTIERRQLSTYTRHKDAQDLFANLRAGGIYHGSLFQNTTNIVQDGREPRAVCDITVRHEASSDTDPAVTAEKTLIHPITLDAVIVSFYTTLPSVGALQEDPKLPSSIASMWVSSDISREVGRTLQCDSLLTRDDAQSGSVDITVIDGQTDSIVLMVQGLECASLGRGSGAAARQNAANKGSPTTVKWEQEVISKLVWGPDLSLRQPLALAQIKEEMGKESRVEEHLSSLLRKIAHKNPSAKILQIGGSNTTHSLLDTLGTPKVPLIGRWHVTDLSTELLEEARMKLVDWADLLEFDQLDIEQNLTKQKFTSGSYDIVLASQVLSNNSAANIRGLLKPGGVLLAETTQDLESVLQDSGFSGVELELCASNSSIILSTVPSDKNRELIGRHNLAVVTSARTPPPVAFVNQLINHIQGDSATTSEHLVLEKSNPDSFKGKTCIFIGELEEPVLADLDETRMQGLRAMITQCSGLLWITTGATINVQAPERALSQGLLRVLRNEYIGRRFLSLDLDPTSEKDGNVALSAITRVLEEGFGPADETGPHEFEYAERNGVLLIPRIFKDQQCNDMVIGPVIPSWGGVTQTTGDETGSTGASTTIPLEPLFQENRQLRLEAGLPGHLDTLAFVDAENGHESLASEYIEITPRAYGLSSRDVLAAMGQLQDRTTGLECAGIITAVGKDAQEQGFHVGDRVMALLDGSAFTNRVQVHWHGVMKIASDMDFNHAASLPLAFTMAYTGLIDTAHLARGQSILVHAAAGAFGQAAIMLAKHVGLTDIYATAGSQEKRDILIRDHGIPPERIFSSRDSLFVPAILAATKGRGVDVVLNSLPGPLLQASLRVVASLGSLIDIGKKEFEANSLIGSEAFSRGLSLTSLDAPTLLRNRGPRVQFILSEVNRLVGQRALRPVSPINVYAMQDVQQAFQYVQSGRQIGKAILSVGAEDQVHVVPRPRGITPENRLRSDASYLVVGGVGGIGRSVAHWLVAHGAKHLILLSRSAGGLDAAENKVSEGASFVRELRETGCRVKPVSCDVSSAASLALALKACENEGFPPVRGIVQGAMLLRDAVFEQMTLESWRDGLSPKMNGTWNLHTQFSKPGSLDFFVMLSSVSGVVGIASQANYAAGGSYEDAMARWRQARGLPGVALDLGPLSDIGYVAKTDKVAERLRKEGDFTMLEEATVLRALNVAVLQPQDARSQIIVGLNASSGPQWDLDGRSQLGRDARFLPLRPRIKSTKTGPADVNDSVSLSSQLQEAGSIDEGSALIGAAIAAKLADTFMIPVEEIDVSKPPAHFGVDSLVAVELRNMLVLQAGADVSIFNILQTGSLAALATEVAEKSRFVTGAP